MADQTCLRNSVAVYGNTLGLYLVSRSKNLPAGKAVKNVLKIPAIYTCLAALTANLMGLPLPDEAAPVMAGISWVLSAIGMMTTGIGLAKVNFKETSHRELGKLLTVRYTAAAVLMGLLLLIGYGSTSQLQSNEQKLLMLIPAFPIAANLVVFASFLETELESASLLVSMSSVISLLLVPVACFLLFGP